MSDKSSQSANESIEKSDLSEIFRSFRDRAGIKQTEMAALLGVHSNYLSQIERGKKTPGSRLMKDFYTLTQSPLYNSAPAVRGPISMPPHQELPPRGRLLEDPPMFGSSGDFDFAQCIKWLSELHEHHPQMFRSAAAMIRGLWESLKK